MKILICSDGSEQAFRALKLGGEIARGASAQVTLLGVSETAEDARNLLEALARGMAYLQERKVEAELLSRPGSPIEQIRKVTEAAQYDLVVIGAVRKQSFGRFWMSSKSYQIIKAIRPPVLSVAGNITTVQRMLICSGGRSNIRPALELSATIAKSLSAEVTLLHVTPEMPGIYYGLGQLEQTEDKLLASKSELGENMRASRDLLISYGLKTRVKLRDGEVMPEIFDEIRSGDYQMVVTGSSLSHSFRTYILGDVSREIINQTHRAVLVARTTEGLPTVFSGVQDLLRKIGFGRAQKKTEPAGR